MTNLVRLIFEVAYVNEQPSLDFAPEKTYWAGLPLDEHRGIVLAIKNREGVLCGYPASWFKLVSDPENAMPATSTIHRD